MIMLWAMLRHPPPLQESLYIMRNSSDDLCDETFFAEALSFSFVKSACWSTCQLSVRWMWVWASSLCLCLEWERFAHVVYLPRFEILSRDWRWRGWSYGMIITSPLILWIRPTIIGMDDIGCPHTHLRTIIRHISNPSNTPLFNERKAFILTVP